MAYQPFQRPPFGAVPGTPVPPAWQQSSTQAGYPATIVRTNRAAVTALALGVAAVTLFFLMLPGVLAIIYGVQARRQIAASNGWETGGGLATSGLVLGIVGVAALPLTLVIWFFVAAANCHGSCLGW